MCVYHGQFGFGDPVTDIVLKSVSEDPITLRGPHSVAIVSHESYIPEKASFMQQEHNMTSSNNYFIFIFLCYGKYRKFNKSCL